MILLSPDAVLDVERLRSFIASVNPEATQRAMEAIWSAVERVQEFPAMGTATSDADVRQIVVRFGSSGYIVRYALLPNSRDILITSIWHGREARR